MTKAPAPAPLTIWHDGSCALCSMEIAHYRKIAGGGMRFVDVSQSDADLPAGLSPAHAMARFHVTTQAGETLSGAQAFIALWDNLPGWRWLARLARLPGIPALLELAYKGFLPLRPWIAGALRRIQGRKPTAPAKSKTTVRSSR